MNTSNCDSSYDELMPEEWIIKLYANMGGQLISCGSDAHFPERISHGFDRLYKDLIKNGFDRACYFKSRKLQTYSIKGVMR